MRFSPKTAQNISLPALTFAQNPAKICDMNYFRKKLKSFPVSEWLITGLILCFAGGFLDAYTYITRGGVFANAQTGNIILLSIGLARGEGTAALRYLVPVAVFVAGVFLSRLFLFFGGKEHGFRAHGIALLAELAALVTAGLLPASVPDEAITVLVAFAAAVQFDNFRKTEGLPFATAFCTGNLRAATEQLFRATVKKEKSAGGAALKYLAVIFAFVGGVFGGYFSALTLGTYSALIPAALLLPILAAVSFGNLLRKKLFLIQTRPIEKTEYDEMRTLIFESFSRFVAPDYTEEGVTNFRKFLFDEALPARCDFFGVYEGKRLQGALVAEKDGSHIRAFFVRTDEQGQGFGGTLMRYFLNLYQGAVTVNASRYGKPIYEKFGFRAVSEETQKDGILFTPMILER